MDKVLTIVILSSGRLVYFKKTVNSLRKTRIDQNQTQILLFLNGFGNEIKEDYREFLQNSGFDFKIFNEKGIKHSELVRLAIYKSREFDHILLCEDDWIFSPNLSINEINRMQGNQTGEPSSLFFTPVYAPKAMDPSFYIYKAALPKYQK